MLDTIIPVEAKIIIFHDLLQIKRRREELKAGKDFLGMYALHNG